MLCGAQINNEEGEGGNVLPVAPAPVFETVAFPFKQTTLPTLMDISKAIDMQYTGTKKVLWERICNSGNENIVVGEDATSFTYRRVKAADGSVPTWIILTKEIVPPVEGIDMATGAQIDFMHSYQQRQCCWRNGLQLLHVVGG